MPTQASSLLDTLKCVELTGRQQDGAVEIFHLRWPGINGLDYITLDEALEAHCIEVSEFTETGQVPRIKIINRSRHMVFVMAGEQLVGCKQNRVVNASIMVPPHSEMPLPVTCVERGRWGYSSPAFSSAHSSSHHRLRAMMAGQAAKSYRQVGVPNAEQAAVWREVSRKLRTTGSSSSSDALPDVFRNYERKLEQSVRIFQLRQSAMARCSLSVAVSPVRTCSTSRIRSANSGLSSSRAAPSMRWSRQRRARDQWRKNRFQVGWTPLGVPHCSRFHRRESGRTCASRVKM